MPTLTLPGRGQMQGKGPEGDRPGGRRRPTVHRGSLGGFLEPPPAGPHLPLCPSDLCSGCPCSLSGVGSSSGTCILWLLEVSIQWEPVKVTGGAHQLGICHRPPAGVAPGPVPLTAQVPLPTPTLLAGVSQVLCHCIRSRPFGTLSSCLHPCRQGLPNPFLRRAVVLGGWGVRYPRELAPEPECQGPGHPGFSRPCSSPGKPGEAVLPGDPPRGAWLPSDWPVGGGEQDWSSSENRSLGAADP